MFAYENWKVYKLAKELRRIATELSRTVPRGFAKDLDQLRRAASSILLNLGEGATQWSKGKKLEFYRIALGSAGECNSVLGVLLDVHPNRKLILHARDLCDHITALLTNLIKSVEGRDDN